MNLWITNIFKDVFISKYSSILSCSLVVPLVVTLFFACSTGSGGADDTPDTFYDNHPPNFVTQEVQSRN